MASYRKMHPEVRWPFAGMIAGAVVGALFVDGVTRWPFYVFTAIGVIAGFVMNAVTKKR